MITKNYTLLFLFLLFSFSAVSQLCDKEAILENAKIEFMVGASFNASNYDSYLQFQDPDGSWTIANNNTQIDYDDKPLNHLKRLVKLSQAYVLELEGEITLNYDVVQGIKKGLNYWYANTPPLNGWWNNKIGKQRELQQIALLFYDIIKLPGNNALRANIIGDFPSSTLDDDDDDQDPTNDNYTGANKADIAGSILVKGILIEVTDEATGTEIFETGRTAMQCSMSYVDMENDVPHENTAHLYEGIQRDNSFHQHKRMLYTGGYGHSLIENVSLWGAILRETCYDYENKVHYFKYILDGCRWMVRGNTTDFSANGRYIIRNYPANNGSIPSKDLVRTIKMTDPDFNDDDCSLSGINCPTSPLGLELLQMRNNALDPLTGVEGRQAIAGNKYFRKSDYVSHHEDSYFSSIKMCSDRTVGTESVNGENVEGYWLPYGCTAFYRRGDEYREIFPEEDEDNGWDWRRIPGVTAPKYLPDFDNGGSTARSTQEEVYFVGATSNGSYGVTAMTLNENYSDDKYVSGKKAWFHFGNEIIALGAGINSNDGSNDIYTNINQMHLQGEEDEQVMVNGNFIDQGVSENIDTDWIHHDGTAYIFPQSPAVTSKTYNQLFTAYINHGEEPEDEFYEYIVVPGITNTEVDNYINTNTVKIIRNDNFVQAVKKDNLVGIVFYPETSAVYINDNCDSPSPIPPSLHAASSFSCAISPQIEINDAGTNLATDKPCILLYEDGKVCISSPDRSHTTINLIVTTNNGNQSITIPFELPEGDRQGEPTCIDISMITGCPTVKASANDGNFPINTLDGNLDTRWSALGDGQYVEYCLDEPKTLSCIEIGFHEGDQQTAFFDVQIFNGSNWITVLSNQASSGISTALEQFVFNSTLTEKIRIIGHGNSNNNWNSYTEVNWKNCNFPEVCTRMYYDEFDEFDDGDDVFGNWNDGGSGCYFAGSDKAFSPEKCIKINDDNPDGSATYSNSFPLSGIEAVTIEFTFITKNFVTNNPENVEPNGHADRIFLEVSVDGGDNYQIKHTWTVEQDFCDGQRVFASVCINDIEFSDATVFRIRTDAAKTGSTRHQAYLDNIGISHCDNCGEEEVDDCFTIVQSSDDAIERLANNAVNTNNQVLTFGNSNMVGLRFKTDIPASTEIVSAYIEFKSASDYNPPTIQRISAVNSDGFSSTDPNATFNGVISADISNRPLFNNSVEWNTAPWSFSYNIQTSDIKELVDAMVSSQNYDGTMIFTFAKQGLDGNTLSVRSFDHSELNAPKLCITYKDTNDGFENGNAGNRKNVIEFSQDTDNHLLVSINPNPFQNQLDVQFNSALTHDGNVTLYSSDGKTQLVASLSIGQKNIVIDSKDWPAGIYYLRIQSGDLQTVEKLVKL